MAGTGVVPSGSRPAWLFGLTGILLARGYWGWALLTLAGAVANVMLAYRVWRATVRLDAHPSS
jgi:hypothetical protein